MLLCLASLKEVNLPPLYGCQAFHLALCAYGIKPHQSDIVVKDTTAELEQLGVYNCNIYCNIAPLKVESLAQNTYSGNEAGTICCSMTLWFLKTGSLRTKLAYSRLPHMYPFMFPT